MRFNNLAKEKTEFSINQCNWGCCSQGINLCPQCLNMTSEAAKRNPGKKTNIFSKQNGDKFYNCIREAFFKSIKVKHFDLDKLS